MFLGLINHICLLMYVNRNRKTFLDLQRKTTQVQFSQMGRPSLWNPFLDPLRSQLFGHGAFDLERKVWRFLSPHLTASSLGLPTSKECLPLWRLKIRLVCWPRDCLILREMLSRLSKTRLGISWINDTRYRNAYNILKLSLPISCMEDMYLCTWFGYVLILCNCYSHIIANH